MRAKVFVYLAGAALIIALSCAGCGPRMRVQSSVKPYEQQLPRMPADVVPTSGRLNTYTTLQAEQSPVKPSVTTLKNGRIYYNYYCVQCHGTDGDGNGPVGQSYVPKPADLTSPAVSRLSDREIYRRMLSGTGHSPVMDQTVLPDHRWPLVAYVKTFAERGQQGNGVE